MDASEAWLRLLGNILSAGIAVQSRGMIHHELMAMNTSIDMQRPIMSVAERRLGYRFMAAEAAWILSGDARVETIAPFSKEISRFSDDGIYFAGAYGPLFTQQLPYIVRSLISDPGTRQAVMTIWRPSPGTSKDIPCTVSLQWMHRGNQLHCLADMRSSDAWLGVPYDWFNFSMASAYVLLCLREVDPNYWSRVVPGELFFRAGSSHLYQKDIAAATTVYGSSNYYPYRSFNIDEFRKPSHLLSHLWKLAKHESPLQHEFGLETFQWSANAAQQKS